MRKAKKSLPCISIEGVGKTLNEKIDSLVKLEIILYWLGYSKNTERDEDWNDFKCRGNCWDDIYFIILQKNKIYSYYSYGGVDAAKQFKADQVTEIINYVLNFTDGEA